MTPEQAIEHLESLRLEGYLRINGRTGDALREAVEVMRTTLADVVTTRELLNIAETASDEWKDRFDVVTTELVTATKALNESGGQTC